MLIRAPVETRSGYGSMSRDIVRHLIDLDEWDVRVWPCPWGNTPRNVLDENNPKDVSILSRMTENPPQNLPRKPEIFISITVPNEFQPLGQYNIGITAGIETTACAPEWIQGMNHMDVIFTISNHSKAVLSETVYKHTPHPGAPEQMLKLAKPIEVLHNCVHTDVFRKIPQSELEPSVKQLLKPVREGFCFLFVGHWLKGDVGADRKDVGMLVRTFLDTFRKIPKKQRPALILKTSGAGFSVMDRELILSKIREIREQLDGSRGYPNVYVIHGDLNDSELNSLYNHPKVKANVTFTKGEGFGRPLLEASMSGKPIIASAWSGHMDFLNTDEAILLSGKLEPVHPSSVWKGVINEGTKWFTADYTAASNTLYTVWKYYSQLKNRGSKLTQKNIERFNYDAIRERTKELMEKYLPKFQIQQQVPLNLPKLKKITPEKSSEGGMPKLKKITPEKTSVPKKIDMSNPLGEVVSHDMSIDKTVKETAKVAQVPQEVDDDRTKKQEGDRLPVSTSAILESAGGDFDDAD